MPLPTGLTVESVEIGEDRGVGTGQVVDRAKRRVRPSGHGPPVVTAAANAHVICNLPRSGIPANRDSCPGLRITPAGLVVASAALTKKVGDCEEQARDQVTAQMMFLSLVANGDTEAGARMWCDAVLVTSDLNGNSSVCFALSCGRNVAVP